MKLVIFDCDGTLVDSQDAICSAMNHAFTGMGLGPPSRGEVLCVVGLSLPEAFLALAPGHSDEIRLGLAERYKSAFPHNVPSSIPRDPLFAGAKTTVEAMARRGDVVLGIATGKSKRGVMRLFDQEGWHSHFRTVQTADDHPSKPHPSMIETAMQEAGVDRDQTVIIGDTSYDIEMGRNAGVATIGVGWGYHDIATLQASGAHHIVTGFDMVEAAVDDLLSGGWGRFG